MLKQNKLAIAVAMTLGATMGGVSLAQATSPNNSHLFFPQVAGGGSVASIVTVVNEAPGAVGDYTNGLIHLRLWSKPWTSAASNTATCGEGNEYPATSYNDIVTFDLFNGGLGGVATAFGIPLLFLKTPRAFPSLDSIASSIPTFPVPESKFL